jgi:hypothetical protein
MVGSPGSARRAASPGHRDALRRDPVASLQDGRGGGVCILQSHGAAPSAMLKLNHSLLNSQTFFPAVGSHFIRMMHSGCRFQFQLPSAQQRWGLIFGLLIHKRIYCLPGEFYSNLLSSNAMCTCYLSTKRQYIYIS